MDSWMNNPEVKIGYAAAVLATAEYERERGRMAVPAVNYALIKSFGLPGLKAVGAAMLAEELTGSRPDGQELAALHRGECSIAYHEGENAWYTMPLT